MSRARILMLTLTAMVRCASCDAFCERVIKGLCQPCYHREVNRRRDRNRGPCRHCQRARANRPRGLCWACYHTPGMRERYPITSKCARRGEIEDFTGTAPLPAGPTEALPGTPEKLAVLEERARGRQTLWHPGDAVHDQRTPPVQSEEESDDV